MANAHHRVAIRERTLNRRSEPTRAEYKRQHRPDGDQTRTQEVATWLMKTLPPRTFKTGLNAAMDARLQRKGGCSPVLLVYLLPSRQGVLREHKGHGGKKDAPVPAVP